MSINIAFTAEEKNENQKAFVPNLANIMLYEVLDYRILNKTLYN